MAKKNPALAPGGLGSRFLAAQLPPALAPGGIGARFQAAQQQSTSQPFTPYQAPPLPSGSYDPTLDAQLGATQRGLGDTTQDYATQASRNQIDYGLQQDAINLNQSRGLADYQTSFDRGSQDLTTGYSRGTQDLTTGFNRGNQDLDRSVMLLQRSYSQLQNRQSQDAAAAGVHGGAALQAAAKRAANQAIDQQPLDTSRARLGEDYQTNTSRLGQDYTTNTSRLGEDFTTNTGRLTQDTANQLGQLGIGYQRTTDDAATALARAQREASQFGFDTEAQKAFQAAQSGYVPPPPPKKRAVLR